MDIECKKFAKDVRLLDKEMRVWDTYIQLEGTVKNMLTSLRAVGELQNPAIRERHWHQLMTSTKVNLDPKSFSKNFQKFLDVPFRNFSTLVLSTSRFISPFILICKYTLDLILFPEFSSSST